MAVVAKNENNKGDQLGDKVVAATQSEHIKGNDVGKQGGSGNQKRNHEAGIQSENMRNHEGKQIWRQGDNGNQKRNHKGKQIWERSRQRQPRAKS